VEPDREREDERACPCCGILIPAGLFERTRTVEAPRSLEELAQSDHATEVTRHAGSILTVNGRSFLPVDVSLPLYWVDSPVAAQVWVETAYHSGDDFIRFQDGRYPYFQALGTLACDIPGFPGSMGAPVQITAAQGEQPRLTWCADMRILLVGREEDFGHQDLVRLYRRLWGGSGDTPAEDQALRKAARDMVKEYYGHFFSRPVTAFGPYAGIQPPEVLVRPPLDTGGEARFATIGIAEAMKGPQKIELVAAARNGGPAFEKSFGEFCFWSRREQNPPLQAGMVIPEATGGIPSYQNLAAWLITENYDTPEGPLCPPASLVGAAQLSYLAAIPITREELAYAALNGPVELLTCLEASGLDVTDLSRASCVTI
jgi:hypothetical protein